MSWTSAGDNVGRSSAMARAIDQCLSAQPCRKLEVRAIPALALSAPGRCSPEACTDRRPSIVVHRIGDELYPDRVGRCPARPMTWACTETTIRSNDWSWVVSNKSTAVVLTALELEHSAVVDLLSRPLAERIERGLVFEVGVFAGRTNWTVAVAQAGPGNPSAGILLERAAATFAPQVALFVGIAGGRKDVQHGDVVVADAVYDYESGKDAIDGYWPRIKTAAPSFGLLQRAQQVARDGNWVERIVSGPPARRPSAFVKPVAAGGKVVAHDRSATERLLSGVCGDALAVDMESYGFLRGAYVNEGLASLVVRGISDLLSDKSAANDRRWQVPAARHAAAFAFEVLSGLSSETAARDDVPEASRVPTWFQDNRPSGDGVVYASQGGNQNITVHRREE